jgi:hypothetical protein
VLRVVLALPSSAKTTRSTLKTGCFCYPFLGDFLLLAGAVEALSVDRAGWLSVFCIIEDTLPLAAPPGPGFDLFWLGFCLLTPLRPIKFSF